MVRILSGGFEESPTPHSNAAGRVRSEFALWSHRKFANNRKARARPLARQTPEACHCHAPTPSVQMANGQPRVVVRPWRHPYDVLGVGFGTPGCAPALGPELLRDRNSYKNNTARAPAFQTWAVRMEKFAKLQRIVLDSGRTRPSCVSPAPQLKNANASVARNRLDFRKLRELSKGYFVTTYLSSSPSLSGRVGVKRFQTAPSI
jgi:hypothetical protein